MMNKKKLTPEELPEFQQSIDNMPEESKLKVDNRLLQIENDRLREALDRIANPIKWMQLDLKEGEQINGQYAIQLSNDAAYLKGIANKTLNP